MVRVQLRIVSGSLRGRKLHCMFHEGVRPTPQMVREALFSILGNAIPDRPFFDVFAGSGAVGFEALSRGASEVVFVERDQRLAGDIERHVREFQVREQCRTLRSDAYRWVERWQAPARPVNVFLSPPFADFEQRPDLFLQLVADLRLKMAPGSVLVIQAEKSFEAGQLPDLGRWDHRKYGRNHLLIWVKEDESALSAASQPATANETSVD